MEPESRKRLEEMKKALEGGKPLVELQKQARFEEAARVWEDGWFGYPIPRNRKMPKGEDLKALMEALKGPGKAEVREDGQGE